MPTADETPTVEITDQTHDLDTITTELNVWRTRLVLARAGAGERSIKTCTDALDAWLDLLSDALLEQKVR